MQTNRRTFMQAFLAGGVLGQGLSLTFTSNLLARPTGEPIVIGHQCDLSGGISSWGYWMNKAARAAVDHLNATDGISGRPVMYVVEDTESSPPTGARKFRSLVHRNNADFIVGSAHSGVNLATAPIARELKRVYIPQGMAEEKTGSKGNRYVFQVGSDIPTHRPPPAPDGRTKTSATSGRSSSPTLRGDGATSTNTVTSSRS